MSANFNCPACGHTIAAEMPPGTQIQCPLCKQVVTVPGPPGGGGPMPPQFGAPPIARVSSGLAIAALVCGIIGLVGCPPVGLVGLILGIVALVRVNRESNRYGGKGLAIGGICTGAASILMWPVLISILLPALSRARESSIRIACAANMRNIGQALYIYAENDPQMLLPEPGADWQARLLRMLNVNAGYVTLPFVCPSDARMSGSSYYYVPGYGAMSDPKQIILYEDPAIHGGEGGNILFQDFHVEFVPSPGFEAMIDSITLPDGTPWAPHEEP